MRKCRAMDMTTAPSSQGFSQGGIRSSDWFSETLLRALHISMVTSTDKAMVVGKRDSKTSQLMPANSGLSSEHFRKFL